MSNSYKKKPFFSYHGSRYDKNKRIWYKIFRRKNKSLITSYKLHKDICNYESLDFREVIDSYELSKSSKFYRLDLDKKYLRK